MSRQNRILSLSEPEKKVEFRIFFILVGMYNAELRMKIFMPAGSGVLSCYVKWIASINVFSEGVWLALYVFPKFLGKPTLKKLRICSTEFDITDIRREFISLFMFDCSF